MCLFNCSTHAYMYNHVLADVITQLENVTSTALNAVGDVTEAVRVVSLIIIGVQHIYTYL